MTIAQQDKRLDEWGHSVHQVVHRTGDPGRIDRRGERPDVRLAQLGMSICTSSFWKHLPGVLDQQMKQPCQGLISSLLVWKSSTSAPASVIPPRKGLRIRAVLPWSSWDCS